MQLLIQRSSSLNKKTIILKFLFLFCNFLLSLEGKSQYVVFEKSYAYPSPNGSTKSFDITKDQTIYYTVGQCPKDGLLYPGSTTNIAPQNAILAYGDNGDTLWENVFGDTILGINTLRIDPISINYSHYNNKLIVTGWYRKLITPSPWTMEYDIVVYSFDIITRQIEWITFLNLYPLTDVKYARFTDILDNGDIVITGEYSFSSVSTGWDNFAARLDKNGNIIWSKRYYLDGFDGSRHTLKMSDGSLIISGLHQDAGASSGWDGMIFKVNPVTGDSIRMYQPFNVPGANNHNIEVRYLGELPNGNFVASVFDSIQTYICYLDTGFNLLNSYTTNGNFNNLLRIDENEYIGYNIDNLPTNVFSMDSMGQQNWAINSLQSININFVSTNIGGLMGAGANGFYICRIDSVGFPAPKICINKPVIHSITAQIGPGFFQLTDSVSGGLPYNPELYHNWRFQDGQRADSANPKVYYNHIAYPTSYWAELIISDGVGCSDTMRIDCYTGQILNIPKKIEKPFKKEMKLYPNPTKGELTISFNTLHIPRKTPRMYTIQLTDVMGKVHVESTQALVEQQLKIDISHLPSGMYVATVTEHTSGAIYRARVVKSEE